ncbi:MAG: hypothetical protein J6V25_09100 [Oscillospiraceae bacterium]|nr:hypothetical protein [Oscillospiraceae bacterium]
MPEYGSGGGYTVVMAGPFASSGGGTGKLTTISAPVANWKGGTSPYSQVIAMDDISVNSKIDIQLSADQIELFSGQDIAFTVENRGGEVTLVAVGDKPSADCGFQATVSEILIVSDGETSVICGNTVKTASFNKTGGKMEKDVNMNGKKVTGLNNPTEDDEAASMGFVNQQMKKAALKDLLGNSDFTNPVNQRGLKDYLQQDSYTIDRWKIYANNGNPGLSVMDGYILFKGGIYQKLDIDASKTYTFAVMTGNNEILCVSGVPTTRVTATKGNNTIVLGRDYSGSLVQVGVTGADETIIDSLKWAALYKGEYTAETLPVYQPKGYGAELAECQRYYRQSFTGSNPANIQCTAYVNPNNEYSALHSMGYIPMRAIPTIKIYSTDGTESAVTEYGSELKVDNISIYGQTPYGFYLQSGGRFIKNSCYVFNYTASADL